MIGIYTSAPRSGTKLMAAVFKNLGMYSEHEHLPFVKRTSFSVPKYDLLNGGAEKLPKFERWSEFVSERTENYFCSDFTKGYALYEIKKRFPEAKILLGIRDISEASNSLANRTGLDQNGAAKFWIDYYNFVIEQIRLIKDPPILLQFDELVTNKMNKDLLSIMNMPVTNENLDILKSTMKKKYNHKGTYPIRDIDESLVNESHRIRNVLRKLCKSSNLKVSILVWGDSIANGYGIPVHKTWPYRLSEALDEWATVSIHAVNGRTSLNALERIKYEVLGHPYDVVLVQFGINDANVWQTVGAERVPRALFKEVLFQIDERIRNAGKVPVYLTPHKVDGLQCYSDTVFDFTIESGSWFVDTGSMIGRDCLLDNAHLNEAGHDVYFNMLMEVLNENFRPKRPERVQEERCDSSKVERGSQIRNDDGRLAV